MSELKPCPFCGGKAKHVISSRMNGDTSKWHKIMCENSFQCGAELGTAISGYQPDYEDCIKNLKERWNKRIDIITNDSTVIKCRVGKITYAIAYKELRSTQIIKVEVFNICINHKNEVEVFVRNINEPIDWWKLTLDTYGKWANFKTAELAEKALSEYYLRREKI